MKCYECCGEYVSYRNARLRVDDDAIGTFFVDGVTYMGCEKCGDNLLAFDEAKKVEAARQAHLDGILKSLPISSFLSAAETATLLGISRQALHKHRRISRGFIYFTDFDGSKVYLRKSVEKFLKKGDGRYILRKADAKPVVYEEGPKESNDDPFEALEMKSGLFMGNGDFTENPLIVGQSHIKESPYAYSISK